MTENEILREMKALLSIPQIQGDDVTVADVAEACGIDRTTAKKALTKRVAAGELVSLRVRNYSGLPVTVWRKASSVAACNEGRETGFGPH